MHNNFTLETSICAMNTASIQLETSHPRADQRVFVGEIQSVLWNIYLLHACHRSLPRMEERHHVVFHFLFISYKTTL